MSEFEKMKRGEVFNGADAEIDQIRNRAARILNQVNQAEPEKRQALFRELFASMGENSVITPPFNCEFGKTVFVGDQTFINMGVIMLDGAEIKLGDHVLVGPNVQFYTASHSLDWKSRRRWETYCKPITVGDDVWIGGNAVICQGVTIGARSVIAANTVVTKDVPPDVLVAGSPMRVIRRLDEGDTLGTDA
ncbi:sugar O-acetyltransferase [Parasalinivibrio latis]|uniref:sugar O-acetyltransferase n=1 Tax=Parasalinivibrio latis TaxID=2952610 RepID=UPI0030E3161D